MIYRIIWIAIFVALNIGYWQTHPSVSLYNAYIGARPQDSLGFLLIIAGVYRFGFEVVVNGVDGPVWYPLLFVGGGMAIAAIS